MPACSRPQAARKHFRPHASRTLRIAGILLLALALPGVAPAQEQNAARKAGRGLAGLTLGVLEIPGNIVRETRANGVISGATVGLAKGLGRFVARELVGVFEVVTAPFEIPADFEPVLEPEFPWDYFAAAPDGAYGSGLRGLEKELTRIPGAVIQRREDAVVVRFPGDVLFGSGSSKLSGEARSRLRGVAETLVRHPGARVAVLGFTDSVGNDDYNLNLSSDRAISVRSFLVAEGVAPIRIVTRGYGESRPVASNATPDGRRENRRVEIELRDSRVDARR